MSAQPAVRVIQAPLGRRTVEAILDLEALGLVHAPGSTCDPGQCKAHGGHEGSVTISLADNGLHADGDIDCVTEVDEAFHGGERHERALQAAHEQMHPQGSFTIERCRERVCRDLLGTE